MSVSHRDELSATDIIADAQRGLLVHFAHVGIEAEYVPEGREPGADVVYGEPDPRRSGPSVLAAPPTSLQVAWSPRSGVDRGERVFGK